MLCVQFSATFFHLQTDSLFIVKTYDNNRGKHTVTTVQLRG